MLSSLSNFEPSREINVGVLRRSMSTCDLKRDWASRNGRSIDASLKSMEFGK